MKRRLTLFLATLLVLSLFSCGEKEPQGTWRLYFRTREATGPALATQPYQGEGEPGPEELLRALLAGPAQEELASPFPRGVSLLGVEWDPEEEGNLQVRLSEQYGGLTDMALTLADYCIVLTLVQVEGVETVEITSDGHTANYRSHQLLEAEEALLNDTLS